MARVCLDLSLNPCPYLVCFDAQFVLCQYYEMYAERMQLTGPWRRMSILAKLRKSLEGKLPKDFSHKRRDGILTRLTRILEMSESLYGL